MMKKIHVGRDTYFRLGNTESATTAFDVVRTGYGGLCSDITVAQAEEIVAHLTEFIENDKKTTIEVPVRHKAAVEKYLSSLR